jgi:septum formation protein
VSSEKAENQPLILASGSRYRAQLLERLGIRFEAVAPDLDESAGAGEPAARLASRLAEAKARALTARFPGRWILGSDQVASCDGELMGKPGEHRKAVEQLRRLSGRTAQFHTAVALARGQQRLTALDLTTVRFRQLGDAEIERYLSAEPAYDCAGSFKCEGLGITLLETVESCDPTGLIGLPLIAVSRLLREAGYTLPSNQAGS